MKQKDFFKLNDINSSFALKVIAAIDFALLNGVTMTEQFKLINARRRYEKKLASTYK